MAKKELDLHSVRCIIERIETETDVLYSSLLAVEVAIFHGPHDASEYNDIIAANTNTADKIRKELRALTKVLCAQARERAKEVA